jgi:hypothetical protein
LSRRCPQEWATLKRSGVRDYSRLMASARRKVLEERVLLWKSPEKIAVRVHHYHPDRGFVGGTRFPPYFSLDAALTYGLT